MDPLCPFRSAYFFTSKWELDYRVLCILESPELPTPPPPWEIYYLFLESSLKWESMTWLAALVMQLRGSLETSVWSTARKGVLCLHFKPTLIGTTWRHALHGTTWNMDRQLNKFWGLNSTCSPPLLPISTSHAFEPLTLSHSILSTLDLFVCIIHDFTTVDFANSACHESSKT
jgi:hypothetical protein